MKSFKFMALEQGKDGKKSWKALVILKIPTIPKTPIVNVELNNDKNAN